MHWGQTWTAIFLSFFNCGSPGSLKAFRSTCHMWLEKHGDEEVPYWEDSDSVAPTLDLPLTMVYFKIPLLLAIIPPALALWPIPRTLKNGTDFLVLSPNFDITVNVANPPQDLLSAISQTKTYLATDKLQVQSANTPQRMAH